MSGGVVGAKIGVGAIGKGDCSRGGGAIGGHGNSRRRRWIRGVDGDGGS